MEPIERPLPNLAEPDTGAFWSSIAERRLELLRCLRCREVAFFPRAHCPACGSLELASEPASGNGTVYTRTVVHRHGHPFFAARCPYVLAWIDLDEGGRMLAEVVADDPNDVAIGSRVQAVWEDHEQGAIVLFALV